MSYTRLAMETDMSLNNKPLTDLEKTGLIKHGLPTDKHSQLSDAFRLGMEWALKEERKAANMNNDKTVSGATSHLTQMLGSVEFGDRVDFTIDGAFVGRIHFDEISVKDEFVREIDAPTNNPKTGLPFKTFREVLEVAADETLLTLRDDFADNGDLRI